MNNYCRNCGEKLTNENICEKCGTKVLTKRVEELDKIQEKKYIKGFITMIILSIVSIMFMISNVDSIILKLLTPLINIIYPLAIVIYIIYAKAKLKYSLFFNIIFWIMVIGVILFILFILLLIILWEYTF